MIDLLLTVALALQPATQPADAAPEMPEMSAEDAAMMQAYMEAGAPGEQHEQLAKLAGDWKATLRYQTPDMPEAQFSEGTCTNTLILGGRFLQSDFRGDMMGMPFQGLQLLGYNNLSGEYESLWIDEMSTHMMYATGTGNEDGSELKFEGEALDPMSGEMVPYAYTVTIAADGTHVMDMYSPMGENGEMVKTFSITYERE